MTRLKTRRTVYRNVYGRRIQRARIKKLIRKADMLKKREFRFCQRVESKAYAIHVKRFTESHFWEYVC